MRALNILSLSLLLGLLTSCAASTRDYFPPSIDPTDTNQTYVRSEASAALRKMREPCLAEPDADAAYRMLMLTGVTPIHAVRVTPKGNGEAVVTINRLANGYRKRGGRNSKSRETRLATPTELTTFLAALENKPLFDQNAMPALERYQMCMHASYFIYEFKAQDRHKVINENFCAHTADGIEIMKAFYAIANITPDKDGDWALFMFEAR